MSSLRGRGLVLFAKCAATRVAQLASSILDTKPWLCEQEFGSMSFFMYHLVTQGLSWPDAQTPWLSST